jgi:hypothetical protein
VDPMIFLGESDWKSDQCKGCEVSVLTCPISLAFDRSCLLLLVTWRPPTMKLISRLAD